MKKILVVITVFLLLFYSMSGQEKNPVNNSDYPVKKFTWSTLSPYQKKLFSQFIDFYLPPGEQLSFLLKDNASIRLITRLAEGLLFRNVNDDRKNAFQILSWVLKYQNTDSKSPDYGEWRTSVANDRKDQNWREFVGCDLIIIYSNYREILPDSLKSAVETGLLHAAKGARIRNVSPAYTNISVMSAFLMEYTGTLLENNELKEYGLKKARDIYSLYLSHKSFSEYNSPTYYGVTLVGLALWRSLSSSLELKEMGRELEKELWHHIAGMYNANLGNFCGPYFRGYGMDMKKYHAITGMWIAIALDDEKLAPLPPAGDPKSDELSNLSPIFHLGIAVPENDRAQLREFTSPGYISLSIPNKNMGDTLKKVTALVKKDWMMGGVWGSRRNWGQIKTGTLHWKLPDGDTGWLLIPGDGKTNVKVTDSQMILYLADKNAREIEMFLYTSPTGQGVFNDNLWTLPGIRIEVNTPLERSSAKSIDPASFGNLLTLAEKYPALVRIIYQVPFSWNTENPLIEFTPK